MSQLILFINSIAAHSPGGGKAGFIYCVHLRFRSLVPIPHLGRSNSFGRHGCTQELKERTGEGRAGSRELIPCRLTPHGAREKSRYLHLVHQQGEGNMPSTEPRRQVIHLLKQQQAFCFLFSLSLHSQSTQAFSMDELRAGQSICKFSSCKVPAFLQVCMFSTPNSACKTCPSYASL